MSDFLSASLDVFLAVGEWFTALVFLFSLLILIIKLHSKKKINWSKKVMEIYITSIKTKNGNLAPCLIADLGYRKAYLSFDKALMSELAELPISALYDIKENDKIVVGRGVK